MDGRGGAHTVLSSPPTTSAGLCACEREGKVVMTISSGAIILLFVSLFYFHLCLISVTHISATFDCSIAIMSFDIFFRFGCTQNGYV